ncbi:MAG: tyrosine-type recombinase/integrase [Terriglobales bacterium]
MKLYKRGKTWWVDFSAQGERFRLSVGTGDWRQAESRAKEMVADALSGRMTRAALDTGKQAFTDASDGYLETRRLDLAESSLKKERQLLTFPKRFFARSALGSITADSLHAYRKWRAKSGAGPVIINMEMGVLRRILKGAKRWHLVGADLRPLRERHAPRRALSPEEKARLVLTARQRPEWDVARRAMTIALNTTMRGCELRGLRWGDVDLTGELVTVRQSKTEAGERVIPLTPDAIAALMELRERAELFGAPLRCASPGPVLPSHFVFPACENGRVDPAKPQRSWRTAWRKLTRAAGLPELRFHDLRHQAITELAESQANEEIIRSIAGHVSPRMLHHYSHIRLEAKRLALGALSAPDATVRPDPGYVTNHGTIGRGRNRRERQVIEKNGRHVGTRTPDLYRVKRSLTRNLLKSRGTDDHFRSPKRPEARMEQLIVPLMCPRRRAAGA